MQVVIPAEASLDLYKAAYVILREKNLLFSNLTIAYPQKGFSLGKDDICVGMNIVRPGEGGKNYDTLQEVITDMRCRNRYAFLTHLPNQLLMCFREHDKTILAINLYAAFDAFRRNFDDQFSLPQKISERKTYTVGKFRIICADSKEYFLTPEDRIALFKTGYQYIVFSSDNTVGIQRTLQRRCPLLTDFARFANLDSNIWFTHRFGHLVISKNNRTPDRTPGDLCEMLQAFLSQKFTAADAAEQA